MIGSVAHDVLDRDAAPGLLDRKLAQIGQHERELLLVIRPLRRLPGVLDEDDSDIRRIFLSERADRVGQLVIRNEDPPPPLGCRLAIIQCLTEDSNQITLLAELACLARASLR